MISTFLDVLKASPISGKLETWNPISYTALAALRFADHLAGVARGEYGEWYPQFKVEAEDGAHSIAGRNSCRKVVISIALMEVGHMGVYKACALFIIWFWGSLGTFKPPLPASPFSPGKNAELQKQIAEVEEKFKEQKKGDPRFYFCCWFRAPFSWFGWYVSGMACRALLGGWPIS